MNVHKLNGDAHQKRADEERKRDADPDQEWFARWLEEHGEAIQLAGWNKPSVFKVEELLRELFADMNRGWFKWKGNENPRP